MSRFTWGVDGYGKKGLCERSGRWVLLDIIEGESPFEAIEAIKQHGEKDFSEYYKQCEGKK